MADRAKRIQDTIDQSEKDKAEAQTLLAQYADKLKAVEAEANAIIQRARNQAEADAEKIITSGRASVEELMANARKQLETEQKAAMAAFRQEAAALVVGAAGRLIGREIKNEDNQHYASMLIEEIPSESLAPSEADRD